MRGKLSANHLLEHHNLQPHRFFSALMELPPQEAFVADLYLPLSLETSSCRKWLYPYNFFHQYLNSTISFILVLEGLNPFTLPQVFLAKLNQEDHPTCRRFSSWKEHNISINVIVVRAHLLLGVDIPRALEPILHLPPADF